MKSFSSAAIVASIILTGEWASDLLARNEVVIGMIISAAGVWAWIGYKSPRPGNKDENINPL